MMTSSRCFSVVMFTVWLFGVSVATRSARAQTFKVLHSFTGSPDGAAPYDGLLRDATGILYGTTYSGGDSTCNCGVVFEIESGGTEDVLYTFKGATDGANPEAGLRLSGGALYGTTRFGGGHGLGTIFKLDTNGTETVLHSFGGAKDGSEPFAGLVLDNQGNIYGDTYDGGGMGCNAGCGTIFKLGPSRKETILHRFQAAEGSDPIRRLVRDQEGNLYGVTEFGGGAGCGGTGCGTVYKLSKSGDLKVLHTFAGGTADGCLPQGSVTVDKNGNLYGTTLECGSNDIGTVWKLSKNGSETVLHNFAGGKTDGAYSESTVVLDASGNLYGTTIAGGAYDDGTVYMLNNDGTLRVLHTFTGGTDGLAPEAGVIGDGSGNLYGTTIDGGNANCIPQGCGVVFKITP